MSDLSLRRWRRYGHDRVYVERADGSTLGYWDVRAGTALAEDAATEQEIEAAAKAYLAEQGEPAVPAPTEPQEHRPAFTRVPAQAWTDLAGNKPGEAVLARAAAERAAAPVRTAVAAFLGLNTDERAWRVGGKGEVKVAERLERLGPEWRVLHSIPVGKKDSDIDHVVIGPGGVYTVNTKHHPDARVWVVGDHFYVNGQHTRYVDVARHEADRAERVLSQHVGFPVAVVGLIAVVGATSGFTVRSQPPDGRVVVVARKEIDRWLKEQRSGYTPDQLAVIYAVARRDTTWRDC